jgi:hypothetical protein
VFISTGEAKGECDARQSGYEVYTVLMCVWGIRIASYRAVISCAQCKQENRIKMVSYHVVDDGDV